MNEQETQFHAALLVVGNLPNLMTAASFDRDKMPKFNPNQFMDHKLELIQHLKQADYFNVHYKGEWRGSMGIHLSEEAALWISEFYQWLLMHQLHRREVSILHTV